MDYEKKYKDSLERARKFKNGEIEHELEIGENIMDYVFPELKESEDERIKEDIIWCLKHSGIKPDKPINPHVRTTMKEALAWLEKQGEQKPTDKVEPKFKVGDWVINTITYDVEQIIEVTSNEYICSGNLIVSFDNQHLLKKWTIQDAKNGDILVSKSNQPFIYNGKMDAQTIGSHGGVLSDGTIFICAFDDCNWTDIRFIYPATKEQCDLLFSKMREAGYKWNMEKKELKKLKG